MTNPFAPFPQEPWPDVERHPLYWRPVTVGQIPDDGITQEEHAAWCRANRELLDRQSAEVLRAFRGEPL